MSLLKPNVPVSFARNWCGSCQLKCKVCFLNLFDNKATPQKRKTLKNRGKTHMGFPSASCLFWSISYNVSQFRELQCRLPGAVWKESCFHSKKHKKKGELTKTVVSHHSGNLSTILSGKNKAWPMWTMEGDHVGSTIGRSQAPACDLLGIYWVI